MVQRRMQVGILLLTSLSLAPFSFAQKKRMSEYETKVEKKVQNTLQEHRREHLDALARGEEPGTTTTPSVPIRPADRREELEDRREALERAREHKWKSRINVYDSNDGAGQDVEIRLNMPIDAFMEYAPIAALEAAAVPHKFPTVYIYLREETTDRVARVAFRDAEPIAGRYLAGDEGAVEEMKRALIWH